MTVKKDIDNRRLREAFFQVYDEGRVMHQLSKLASGRQVTGLSLIGEGMHFRAWREKRTGGAMDLVLKVASEEFLSEVGNIEAWRAKLGKMPVGIDMMPPVAFVPLKVEATESIGMVMPYGPDGKDKCSSWWQPLSEQLTVFKEGARASGLTLGDIPQIRCWQGIPFIIDISDLRAI